MNPELKSALQRCEDAAVGDSNDEEIDALRDALDLALSELGIGDNWRDA